MRQGSSWAEDQAWRLAEDMTLHENYWRNKYASLLVQNIVDVAELDPEAWAEFIREYPAEVAELRRVLRQAMDYVEE